MQGLFLPIFFFLYASFNPKNYYLTITFSYWAFQVMVNWNKVLCICLTVSRRQDWTALMPLCLLPSFTVNLPEWTAKKSNTPFPDSNNLFVVGGNDNKDSLYTAQRLCQLPQTDPNPQPRLFFFQLQHAAAARSGGKTVVCGGIDPRRDYFSQACYSFDGTNGVDQSWIFVNIMFSPRAKFAIAQLSPTDFVVIGEF